MSERNNYALHIRLIQVANLVLDREFSQDAANSISKVLDEYKLGESLETIQEAIDAPKSEDAFISQEDLDAVRVKNQEERDSLEKERTQREEAPKEDRPEPVAEEPKKTKRGAEVKEES